MNAASKFATPISKLYGVSQEVRRALKVRGITTSEQLLEAASRYEDREALARLTHLGQEALTAVVLRADMARMRGIGTCFARMLAELGVLDVATLAVQDPQALQRRLDALNRSERLVRRSPAVDEVTDWVAQACRATILVTHVPQPDEPAIIDGPLVGAAIPMPAPLAGLSS